MLKKEWYDLRAPSYFGKVSVSESWTAVLEWGAHACCIPPDGSVTSARPSSTALLVSRLPPRVSRIAFSRSLSLISRTTPTTSPSARSVSHLRMSKVNLVLSSDLWYDQTRDLLLIGYVCCSIRPQRLVELPRPRLHRRQAPLPCQEVAHTH